MKVRQIFLLKDIYEEVSNETLPNSFGRNIFIMPYGSYLCNIRQIWYKLIEYDLDSIKQVNVLFILT